MKKIKITANNPYTLLAVYGTLRLGQGNYKHLLEDKAEYLGTYQTEEAFSMYGKGHGFPIVSPNGDTAITYDVFKVTDNNVLRSVHNLEGFTGIKDHPHNWYNVTEVETPHGKAYMYVQDGDWNDKDLIKTGDWLNQNVAVAI